MKLGVCFDGMSSVKEMVALARAAEERGVDSIWMAEHFSYRDAFTSCMAFLGATERIRVAPVSISPYAKHPMAMAMAAATLEEYAPGRVILVLGTGNPRALGEIGLRPKRPLTTIRETLEVLKLLFRGGPVSYRGEVFCLEGARMGFGPQRALSIYLAAIGPRMLELAGEAADGVLLSAGASMAYLRRAIHHVRHGMEKRGRRRGDVTLAALILASLHPDGEQARQAAKPLLAYFFRSPFTRELMDLGGTEVDQEAVARAVHEGDLKKAARLVPDEIVRAHAIAGTAKEAQAQVQAYLEAGIDLPILLPTGSGENQARVLDILGG